MLFTVTDRQGYYHTPKRDLIHSSFKLVALNTDTSAAAPWWQTRGDYKHHRLAACANAVHSQVFQIQSFAGFRDCL